MTVEELRREAPRAEFSAILDSALALDKLYIPTRHPDALAELTPAEAYTRSERAAALGHAGRSFRSERSG